MTRRATEDERQLLASIMANPKTVPAMREAVSAVLDEIDAWRSGKQPC